MYFSAEIRWFWDKPVKVPIELGPAKIRTDRYLVFPDPGLGVKMREGNLEIKNRLGYSAHRDWLGAMEQWVKWSDAIGARKLGGGEWVDVKKSRRLAVYEARGADLFPVKPSDEPANGCNLELTEIKLENVHAWTIGFEAFGTVGREVILNRALQLSAAWLKKVPRSLENSCGYPEWILRNL